jgi:hypothetical protein
MPDKSLQDLNGYWLGIYNYPDLSPPNRFEANLRDAGGALTGEKSEKDDLASGNNHQLHAIIEGRHDGKTVSFVKIYDDMDQMPDVVRYSGRIQSNEDEISGDWSGTFIMIRNGGASEAAKRTEKSKLPV